MRPSKTALWLAASGGLAVVATAWAVATVPAVKVGQPAQARLPEGIKTSLVAQRATYFLGENILVHYRVGNTGDKPFKISVGGDYRGSSRADRFKVTATSSDDQPVPDPTPLMRNFGGGMGMEPEIKPGDDWFENINVPRYLSFTTAGIYTINAFHDLGLGPRRDDDPRVASLTITLEAPTETQADAILTEDENALPYSGPTWGEKAEARLDYSSIRHSAFLPALVRRAQNGNRNALQGLASISTTEATQALVNLLQHPDGEFRTQVAATLTSRLPQDGLPAGNKDQTVAQGYWDKSLTPPTRHFALNLLASTRRRDLMTATALLRRIGTPDEVPALLKALEFAVSQTDAEYLADIHYPAPQRAVDELLVTAMTIDPNLDISPRDIQSPGEALLFIARHGGREGRWTKEEEEVFARLVSHPLPYVRMKALDNLPEEIPTSLGPSITERLTDEYTGVRNYAFVAAERMQEPRHREFALAVLHTPAEDQWLDDAAHRLAVRYGASWECAQAWAARLVVPRDINDYATHRALSHLFEMTTGRGPNGGFFPQLDAAAARALRERWEAFLTANKDKIRAGHLFHLGDGDMPDDLLPDGWSF